MTEGNFGGCGKLHALDWMFFLGYVPFLELYTFGCLNCLKAVLDAQFFAHNGHWNTWQFQITWCWQLYASVAFCAKPSGCFQCKCTGETFCLFLRVNNSRQCTWKSCQISQGCAFLKLTSPNECKLNGLSHCLEQQRLDVHFWQQRTSVLGTFSGKIPRVSWGWGYKNEIQFLKVSASVSVLNKAPNFLTTTLTLRTFETWTLPFGLRVKPGISISKFGPS